jgi:hypothetical protein
MLDSETTQRMPALLDCRILATVLLTRRRCPGRRIACCDGGPDWATPCRQVGPGSSTCRDFLYLDWIERRSRSTLARKQCDARRQANRRATHWDETSALAAAPFVSDAHLLLHKLPCVCGRVGIVVLVSAQCVVLRECCCSRSRNFGSASAIWAIRTCRICSCAKTRRSRSIRIFDVHNSSLLGRACRVRCGLRREKPQY